MSTKSDLQSAWVRLTGMDTAWTRHRIRTLSEAGLLPERSGALTRTHLARWLLSVVVSETHLGAARELEEYARMVAPPALLDIYPELRGRDLLETTTEVLPTITKLEASPQLRHVVVEGFRHDQDFPEFIYDFAPGPRMPGTLAPVVSRHIGYNLISRLLSELEL